MKWVLIKIIYLIGGWILLCLTNGSAQNITISGKITDAKTNEGIPFVNIVINDGASGTTSDIDGKFTLSFSGKIQLITFSCIGYENFVYKVLNSDDIKPLLKPIYIKLFEKAQNLKEVVVSAGQNPAHRIIDRAVKNRNLNNPEKISSFQYLSYNKFYVTLENEPTQEDSILVQTWDSTDIRMLDYFSKRHLFLSETVAERKYIAPNFNRETILANKVSGFKNPSFATLATDFQPFSFYKDYIELLEKQFLNPISKGSTEKYYFALEDKILMDKDTLFIISFTPLPNKNFEGLEGLLYIHSAQYALQSVTASTLPQKDRLLNFKIQQKYDVLEGKYWFPTQLHTDIRFEKLKVGERRYIGISRSYLYDIQLFAPLKRRDFDEVSKVIDKEAHTKTDDFWENNRIEPLMMKEINTFSFLDSLGSRYKIDNVVRLGETVMSGRLPFKKILEWDFRNAFRINRYEGLRLTASFFTNQHFSEKYTLGAYVGFGTKDTKFKYGVSGLMKVSKRFDWQIGTEFKSDVFEPGNAGFFEEKPILSGRSVRQVLIERMDITRNIAFYSLFRPLRNIQIRVDLDTRWVFPTYDYVFFSTEDTNNPTWIAEKFHFIELALQLHYAFAKDYVQIANRKIFIRSKFPTISLNYTRGLDMLGGQFTYNKWEVKAEYSLNIRHLGKTTFHLQSALADGNTPYQVLYNGLGTTRQMPLRAENYFQTMEMYEFLSDRFFALFVVHNFGKLLYKPKFKLFQPELAFTQAVSFGSLKNPERHQNIGFKTLDNGYFESGLMLNHLISINYFNLAKLGLGAGVFFRYGAYSNPTLRENIAYRLTLGFGF